MDCLLPAVILDRDKISPQVGTKSDVATYPLPSRGHWNGYINQYGYITPAFSGSP